MPEAAISHFGGGIWSAAISTYFFSEHDTQNQVGDD